jgi:hypothetical protein
VAAEIQSLQVATDAIHPGSRASFGTNMPGPRGSNPAASPRRPAAS